MSASSKKKIRKEQNAELLTERQKKEKSEAKKLKLMTSIFAAAMALILVIVLCSQVFSSITRNGLFEKMTTAATIGEHKINSVMMNYYLTDAINAEYNEASETYGDYVTAYYGSMGLDLSKPLNTQIRNQETGETWADYFMDAALSDLKNDYTMYDMAMAENFQLPENAQTSINTLMMNLQFYAAFSGASGVDEYLRGMYGNGAAEDSFREYNTISTTAAAYYNAKLESLEYTDDQLRAHEKDHYNDYSAYTFQSYAVSYNSFLKDGTKDDKGNTTYTEEQKDAARQEALAVATALAEATTVEELDKAIAELEINAELETKPTSTKNENVMHTSLKEEYSEWLSSADRAEGDVKVFESKTTTTVDGKDKEVVNTYNVLMYVSRNENLEKLDNVRHILINFEGGKTDDKGNTTYTAEEKAKAKTAADELLKKWKDGEATEESFIALVAENSDDAGSKDNGGLIEDIHRDSNLVPNFLSWSIDPARAHNDTAVVESPYGYHVMYYCGEDELTYRDYMIQNVLKGEDMEAWLDAALEAATLTEGDFSRVNLDLVFAPAK